MKKSEEIGITDDDDDDETEKKETASNTRLTPARVKRSARVQSSGLSDEIVPKQKKIEMAGKKVIGGRVKKESSRATGRKKAKEEDEVKVIEVVKLE